jgi:hypothetical protein
VPLQFKLLTFIEIGEGVLRVIRMQIQIISILFISVLINVMSVISDEGNLCSDGCSDRTCICQYAESALITKGARSLNDN